eukprot:3272147-Pyramimonas_sp.AAC.1
MRHCRIVARVFSSPFPLGQSHTCEDAAAPAVADACAWQHAHWKPRGAGAPSPLITPSWPQANSWQT